MEHFNEISSLNWSRWMKFHFHIDPCKNRRPWGRTFQLRTKSTCKVSCKNLNIFMYLMWDVSTCKDVCMCRRLKMSKDATCLNIHVHTYVHMYYVLVCCMLYVCMYDVCMYVCMQYVAHIPVVPGYLYCTCSRYRLVYGGNKAFFSDSRRRRTLYYHQW